MMSRDIIDNGCARLAARATDNNPAPNFTGPTSQCIRIEFEQVTQRVAVSASQLLENPAIQGCIDPARARSSWIMGKSAGCHDRYFLRPIFERIGNRLAQIITYPGGRHGRKIA